MSGQETPAEPRAFPGQCCPGAGRNRTLLASRIESCKRSVRTNLLVFPATYTDHRLEDGINTGRKADSTEDEEDRALTGSEPRPSENESQYDAFLFDLV